MFKYKKSVLFLILLALVFALVAGGKLPYFLFYCIFLVVVLSYLWAFMTVKRLNITQEPDRGYISTGEELQIKTHIKNRSFLPIPFIEITNNIAEKISATPLKSHVISIKPFGSKTIVHNIKCKYRGIYTLGPVTISISDIFGIFTWNKTLQCEGRLYIYPKVVKLNNFIIKPARTFGTVAAKNKMYEDNSSVSDIKKYNPGDSFRKIHWKVSAKKGSLHVKNFDMCGNMEISIFLNLFSLHYSNIYRLDMEEKAVECAASIIFYALSRNISSNLYVNCNNTLDTRGRDMRDFKKFMEEFIVVKSNGHTSFREYLELKSRNLTSGSSVVLITPHMDKDLLDIIIQLKEKRFNVIIVYIMVENLSEDILKIITSAGIKFYKVGTGDNVKGLLEG